MERQRRRVLSALGSLSAVALAGCAGDGGDETGGDGPAAGSTQDGDDGDQQGSTGFEQQEKLSPDDGAEGDTFGTAVGIANDGRTAVVGAEGDEHRTGGDAGAAYVFSQVAEGWQQDTKLTADDRDGGDTFGEVLAMAGDGQTVIVGARNDEDPNGKRAGAAYVFELSGGGWEQATKLTASDGDDFDEFGHAVAIAADGSTAVVGARYEQEPNGGAAGAAYVFERSGEAWQESAKLAAEDGDTEDEFGYSVAIARDGQTVVAGARNDEDPNGAGAGAAYVFARTGGRWEQDAKLVAADGDAEYDFGEGVAMAENGGTVVVGADSDEDPNGDNAGSAYAFSRRQGNWQQDAKLAPADGDTGDDFGEVIGLTDDGRTAIVSADSDEDPNGEDAGSAYVFSRSGTSWQEQAKLAPDDGDAGDKFGGGIAIAGDGGTVIVGADSDQDPNGDGAGSAYVFQ